METFKEISKSEGYQSLKKTVIRDCMKGGGCFNTMGCKVDNVQCFHRYCDTFKWIIDRAKHYSYMTNISVSHILNSWERDRSYSWNNYYQDANQPKIRKNKVHVVENREEIKHLGSKGFRCPYCGGVSTDPFECDSGIIVKTIKMGGPATRQCDWKSYGLFGTLSTGIYLFVKDIALGKNIFMPISLEEKIETGDDQTFG